VTVTAFAAKVVLDAPAGTDTEDGTDKSLLLLARPMSEPVLEAGALSFTVQVSEPAPIMVVDAHVNPAREAVEGDPLPCSLTVLVVPPEVFVFAFTLS
jgi:hypothetical protein